MHRKHIDAIIKYGDNNQMEEMKRLFVKTIDYLKDTDYDKYCEIEDKLYEIVEGKRLSEERAKEWVKSMPQKWSFDEVKNYKMRNNIEIPEVDLYAVMNKQYRDYHETLGDGSMDKYAQLAKNWYYSDSPRVNGSEKTLRYYRDFGQMR